MGPSVKQAVRKENWPSIMDAEIEKARGLEFKWGESDCALWAANVVREMTGVDYADTFRGKYSTAAGSVKALKKYGSGSLTETITSILGEAQPLARTMRGDVVLAVVKQGGEERECAGICIGPRVAFRTPDGITYLPLLECACSWRIV